MVYIRKVQKIGSSSLFITIPKAWCEKYGIREGETVELIESTSGDLIVLPKAQGSRESMFLIDLSKVNLIYVDKLISYAYINGYSVIKIVYSRKQDLESIKDIVETKFMGLILTSEKDNEAVFSFALDTNQLNFYELFKRMDRLTSLMLDSVDDEMSVLRLDAEVDRIYFLLVRMLRTGLTNSEVAKRLGLDPVRFLDFRLVLHFIESFGDEITAVAGKITPKEVQPIKSLKEAVIKAFLGDSRVKVDEIETLTNEAYELVRRANKEASSSLSRMIEMAKDIADLSETLYLK
ncbi:MAG: AbrB/MazE/SpoVT family DNA-binding domain-containing protein [Nitrososphaeria archaeon]